MVVPQRIVVMGEEARKHLMKKATLKEGKSQSREQEPAIVVWRVLKLVLGEKRA